MCAYIEDVLLEGILEHGEEIDEEDVFLIKEMAKDAPALYVMTNRSQTFGASCMLYDSALEDFAKSQGCNVVILPSSIHEVLLLKHEKGMDFKDMREMVMEVNEMKCQKKMFCQTVYICMTGKRKRFREWNDKNVAIV